MAIIRWQVILVLLFARGLVSCGVEQTLPASVTDSLDSSLTGTAKEGKKDSSLTAASAPVVRRSALPPGYGKFTMDSNQVSQYIRCIFQDNNGNLWFGTVGEGLCRYNGNFLSYFSMNDGLGGNSVQAMVQDKKGDLWIATSGGLCRLKAVELEKDSLRFYCYTSEDGLSGNLVWSLYIDRYNNLWVGTDQGVCRADLQLAEEKGKVVFTASTLPGSAGPLPVRCIAGDAAGNTWFATSGGGAYCYREGQFYRYSVQEGLGHSKVHWIMQDRNNVLWFATLGGGFFRYDPAFQHSSASSSFVNFRDSRGSNEVWFLFEDRSGRLWVSTRGEVRCYDPATITRTVAGSYSSFGPDEGLTNTNLQSIYQDKAGHLWFGSGAGLFIFRENAFMNVTKKGPWPHKLR